MCVCVCVCVCARARARAYARVCGCVYVYNCTVPLGFLPWEFRVAFPGESQQRQSHVTRPTVYAGCFSVSIIDRTLTWTTGSLTCAQMSVHVITHGGVRTYVRESALKVDSGRTIPCRTGESNLRQQRAGPTPCQLSYIPSHGSIYTELMVSKALYRRL